MNSPVNKITGLFFCLLLFLFCHDSQHGPAMASYPERFKKSDEIARRYDMQSHIIETTKFKLQSWSRIQEVGKPLRIYIEGDGYAWRTWSKPSWDPTPRSPLFIELAGMDDFPNIVYLARPCQFIGAGESDICDQRYWTDARFSEDVIASMNEAISKLKETSQAPQLDLIGYSGGAAVSLLVASRRSDVASLRTIAGNLDPGAVNRKHRVSELKESLDPLDVIEKIQQIPQLHYVGDKDKIIPMDISRHFVSLLPATSCAKITVLPGATHNSGWKEHWKDLLKQPLPCASNEA